MLVEYSLDGLHNGGSICIGRDDYMNRTHANTVHQLPDMHFVYTFDVGHLKKVVGECIAVDMLWS